MASLTDKSDKEPENNGPPVREETIDELVTKVADMNVGSANGPAEEPKTGVLDIRRFFQKKHAEETQERGVNGPAEQGGGEQGGGEQGGGEQCQVDTPKKSPEKKKGGTHTKQGTKKCKKCSFMNQGQAKTCENCLFTKSQKKDDPECWYTYFGRRVLRGNEIVEAKTPLNWAKPEHQAPYTVKCDICGMYNHHQSHRCFKYGENFPHTSCSKIFRAEIEGKECDICGRLRGYTGTHVDGYALCHNNHEKRPDEDEEES
jgi:hypothetical protein